VPGVERLPGFIEALTYNILQIQISCQKLVVSEYKENSILKKPIIVLFSMTFLWLKLDLKAQLNTEGFLDLGKSNISEGFYSNFSHIGSLEKAKWGIQGGYQLGLVQPQDVILNSWFGNINGKFRIGNATLVLGGEYLWESFSTDMRETNWILFASTRLSHWQLGIGTNNRTYRLSHKAARNSQLIDPESRITENLNVMYHIRYMLKAPENKWNLTLSLLNYDRFIIQQENNPMLNLRFDYELNSPISLYSELWYKSSGLLVIKVTHFGMFLRIGVLWKI
jgi:hypothetical protein